MSEIKNFDSLFRLDSKIALVTGGSRGIGLHTATGFLKAGASTVIISARRSKDIDEAVKKLKAESPKGSTGKYAKGWTRKLDRGRVSAGAVVYGKTASTYAVAHLLEHGHVKRNGTGRTFGKTQAIVHIEPIEQWAVGELEDRIISKLDHNMGV